jgi:hypothetical protein
MSKKNNPVVLRKSPRFSKRKETHSQMFDHAEDSVGGNVDNIDRLRICENDSQINESFENNRKKSKKYISMQNIANDAVASNNLEPENEIEDKESESEYEPDENTDGDDKDDEYEQNKEDEDEDEDDGDDEDEDEDEDSEDGEDGENRQNADSTKSKRSKFNFLNFNILYFWFLTKCENQFDGKLQYFEYFGILFYI